MVTRSSIASLRSLKLKTPSPQTRFRLESLGLFVAACLFITASHIGGWFASLDRIIYDSVIANVSAPQNPDVVLVSIDDQTLHQFGPWPWPRAMQAQLINAITRFQPRATLVDIIYSGTNPDNPQLVKAAARVEQLALPIMVDTLAQGAQHIEVLPFPNLLDHADILGHVQVERDADAIVRGTHLYQGVGNPHWPHLMVAVAAQIFDHATPTCTTPPELASPMQITKCDYIRIPFAGPPGTYPQVSAKHLLTSGGVDEASLRQALNNKIVLVGITALGSSDWVTSPFGTHTTPLSGVEFNANLLSALLSNSTIHQLPTWLVVLVGILISGFCTLSLPLLRPKQALMTSLALAALPVLATMALLAAFWISLPLANVTIATLLIYPLWSWRRHEIAWSFIQSELDRIEDEETKWQLHRSIPERSTTHRSLQMLLNAHITLPSEEGDAALVHRDSALTDAEQVLLNHHLKTLLPAEKADRLPAERLAAQISSLEDRAHHLRQSRDIGLAGLDRMSSGAVIITDLGDVRFINKTAERMLSWSADKPLLNQLEQILPPLGQNWQDIWRAAVLDRRTVSFESSLDDRPIFLTAAPLDYDGDQGFAPSWVLTLSDLSEVREAQAQREEALAFLSHDLRSPLASILALIQQAEATSVNHTLLERIQRYTQKGLATSDQFLQLSRLQLHPSFEKYSLELEQLIHNAIEQVYFLAKEKNIEIKLIESNHQDGIWVEGNGELLERALVNLLGNAIKYSRSETSASVTIELAAERVVIRISDQGYGIPEDEVRHIFEPFFRSAESVLAQNRGAGLGLRFVKTVIERHRGEISVNSVWGQGTTFTIQLPLES